MDDPELAAIRARKLRDLMAAAPREPATGSWSGPIHLTDATFDGEVRKPGLILVDFWAEWCGPCHLVAPILEEVARAHAAALRLGKLNVDESPRTAERFRVTSIPTMLLFKDGKPVDGIVGAVPRPQIDALVMRWKCTRQTLTPSIVAADSTKGWKTVLTSPAVRWAVA